MVVELVEVDADGQELFGFPVELVQAGNRRFKVVPIWTDAEDSWLTAKQAAAYLKMMGVEMDFKGVYRLADEGLIEGRYLQPHTRRFGLSSLKAHASGVLTDPEYWDRRRTR